MQKWIKKIFIGHRKGERGFAFPLVLVLLLIGSLIITPLLSQTNTGLRAGKLSERHMERLYAADAGVEEAIWGLITETLTVPVGNPQTITGPSINNMTASVTVDNKGDDTYQITSVATDSAGSSTNLDVYVSGIDFSDLFDNAVTSRTGITWQPGSSTNGTQEPSYTGDWPEADFLREYYLDQVDTSSPYGSGSVDIKTTPAILPAGPLYRVGDLDIKNTGSAGLTGQLNGTVYVEGDLDIGLTNKDFTLDLNDHTIFVDGNIEIGGKCTITGSGCIIAVGDIDFAPNMSSGPNDFLFIMSVEGEILMHPNGDFYGCLVGDAEVQMQPGCTILYPDPSGTDFNFPDGIPDGLEILAWRINP